MQKQLVAVAKRPNVEVVSEGQLWLLWQLPRPAVAALRRRQPAVVAVAMLQSVLVPTDLVTAMAMVLVVATAMTMVVAVVWGVLVTDSKEVAVVEGGSTLSLTTIEVQAVVQVVIEEMDTSAGEEAVGAISTTGTTV